MTAKIGVREIRLLASLSNACGVSGDEGQVRQIIRRALGDRRSDSETDSMGNLLLRLSGRGRNRLKVMVAAHMDEVGFILTHDEGGGIFRFERQGGLDPRRIGGRPVWVGAQHIPGVIAIPPFHFLPTDKHPPTLTKNDLRIDLGPEGAKVAKIGDRATFATHFRRQGDSLFGKAMDDRLGVATLIQLVKSPPPHLDLLAAFTVQEEVGLRGARVAAYTLAPDVAIALECTPANDLPSPPEGENSGYNAVLGGGPVIYIADRRTISDPRLTAHFIETAERQGIPYQLRQPTSGGTDAGAIHLTRAGIPSLSLSVPARYLHGPCAHVRLSDWRYTVRLVFAALADLRPKLLQSL